MFLVTAANDGTQAVYFVAQNVRHSILPSDVQTEEQINPLWPVRSVNPDEVLAYPEGAPLGNARAGLVTPAPVPIQADAAPAASTYILQPGDNLTHIARDNGTTVEAILAANGISNPNRIYSGQTLVIPTTDSPVADTSTNDNAQDSTVAEVPATDPSANAQDTAVAEVPATDPSADAQTYTVQRGDAAIKVARRFGISTDELLSANDISDPNRVYVGQVLTIPAASS